MASKSIGIRPVGEYILVKPLEETEEKTASGLIIQSAGKGEKPQKGKIIALGAGRRDDNGKLVPFGVEKDQIVYFKKYSPEEVEHNGEKMLLMKESDILAIID